MDRTNLWVIANDKKAVEEQLDASINERENVKVKTRQLLEKYRQLEEKYKESSAQCIHITKNRNVTKLTLVFVAYLDSSYQ